MANSGFLLDGFFVIATCYSTLRKMRNGTIRAQPNVVFSPLACERETLTRTECAKAEKREATRSGVDVQAESPWVPEGYPGGVKPL